MICGADFVWLGSQNQNSFKYTIALVVIYVFKSISQKKIEIFEASRNSSGISLDMWEIGWAGC